MQRVPFKPLARALVAAPSSQLPGGGTVVDDSYNANPAAVNAALEVLARQPGYRVLVLGPMLELGQDSQSLHHEVGRYAGSWA